MRSPLSLICRPLLLVGVLALPLSAMAKQPPMQTVANVDIPRYMGDWYVIAHLPIFLEKGKVGTIDRYVLRPDGKIDNAFLFRKGSLDAPLQDWKAIAWVHDKNTKAEWRVRFIWPFSAKYLVIDLDKNYQWAVVGHPKRKLGWVLSRTPTMDDETYEHTLKSLAAQGYDTAKFVKVPQKGG